MEKQTMTFQQAWEAPSQNARSRPDNSLVRLRWQDLLVPLPEIKGPAWAYALTFRVHQAEARLDEVFSFEKRGIAESASAPIQHRPALDYEAEIALLLHRNEPERFGFLFANDLTDRAVQVQTYNRQQPAAVFSAAKSFPGALRAGPLLIVGNANLWPELEVRLTVNGEARQHLKASDCLLTPRAFHEQIFANPNIADWALVLTGTTGGTIFQSPSPVQRWAHLLRHGFSIRRARQTWMQQFQFLRVGDRLEMKSEMLGMSHATIVASTA